MVDDAEVQKPAGLGRGDALICYGLGAYGLTFPVHLNKIKDIQVRLLKLLTNKKEKDEVNKDYTKLFKTCKILPIESKVKVTLLLEHYNNNKYKAKLKHIHPVRRVARKHIYRVPGYINYFGKRTRRWLIPTILNNLPHEITCQQDNVSRSLLKNILKKHYLSMCP
ncbi:hypothetical protein ACJJTC_011900 [Scirpophaga incertulas]